MHSENLLHLLNHSESREFFLENGFRGGRCVHKKSEPESSAPARCKFVIASRSHGSGAARTAEIRQHAHDSNRAVTQQDPIQR